VVLWLCCLSGCQTIPVHPTPPGASPPEEEVPVLAPYQAADLQVVRGRSLEQQGDLAQARSAYLEALKNDPTRADACDRLAVVSCRQNNPEESGKWWQEAQKTGKASADVHCNRGYGFYLQGRWEEAEQSLRQALADDPNHGRAHNNLGLVLAHHGRGDEALSEFRKAGCNKAEAHNNLAFALTLKGDWPAARAQYEEALALDPSFVQAREGLRRVKALQTRMPRGAPDGPEGPMSSRGLPGSAHPGVAQGWRPAAVAASVER
jgi:Tfp pilus assembly protein PilF